MKINLGIYISFTLILFAFNVILAQDCKSTIAVSSDDTLAVIFLNNSVVGHGSINLELPLGKYLIKAKSSSRRWNAEQLTDTVFLNECGIKKGISLNFKKDIYLNSTPSNAEVYFRDSLIGTTPLYIASNIPQVDLKKKDYRPESVYPDRLSESSVIKLDFVGKHNGESFLKTNMFKILLGSAVILGGTAAYFKLKANDYFDDYNVTGNQASLNMTNKYDLVSGIAFGALQVNFGAILYYLLIEQ